MSPVSAQRCPACGAAVPDGAEWCSLCWADLRTPVAAAPAGAAAAGALETDLLPPRPAAAADERPTAVPGWPCAACGTRVPMEHMHCPRCGASFLPKEPVLAVPGLGAGSSLGGAQRVGLMVGGTALLSLVLFAVAWLVGLVL